MEKTATTLGFARRLALGFGLIWLSTIAMPGGFAQTAAGPTAGNGQAPAADGQSAAAAPPPAAAAAPAPPPFVGPAITGPLQGPPPFVLDAGEFGKISVNGILTGMGLWQDNYVPGDNATQAALSNGQVFISKTDGWFQFSLQAGAYDLPSLGTPFLSTQNTISDLYGPLPIAYVKLAPSSKTWKNTSILIGELPTLIGAETTFTFEDMNVERGLLWNQENAVNRGVQLNQTMGKFTASFSVNDGFYSNRYSWLSGALTFTQGAHMLEFVAGGNLEQDPYLTVATPLIDNSSIYNVIYMYTKGAWMIEPYWQYTDVPVYAALDITKATSTQGGAILVSRTFKKGFSLAARWEYIASSGSPTDGSANLLYGPGSSAWSATVTPTFQYGGLFFRGDLAWVQARNTTPGDVFGAGGMDQNQSRAVGEIGFILGKTEK